MPTMPLAVIMISNPHTVSNIQDKPFVIAVAIFPDTCLRLHPDI
jgi:hypothetical protein